MSDADAVIRRNLTAIRQRIADAAAASGRTADSVTLVAVTKYVDAETARRLSVAGCGELGESRPQELWRKAAALADSPVRWHLIGHLQTNKLRRTLPLVGLMHSIDSLRLLDEIERVAAELDLCVPALIEVNISGESAKHGFAPDEVGAALRQAATLEHVQIRGLMGMSGREHDLDEARRAFARLRHLRDQLRGDLPERVSLDELSMGMSDDFEAAIAEGATLVRIGTLLYEGLET